MSHQLLYDLLRIIEATSVNDEAMPETPPEEQVDTVVGIASHELRQIWCAFVDQNKKAKLHALKAKRSNGERRTAHVEKAAHFQHRAETIREIFWNACRDEFSQLSLKKAIGVRKDWQIVWMDVTEHVHVGIPGGPLLEMLMQSASREMFDDDSGESDRPQTIH